MFTIILNLIIAAISALIFYSLREKRRDRILSVHNKIHEIIKSIKNMLDRAEQTVYDYTGHAINKKKHGKEHDFYYDDIRMKCASAGSMDHPVSIRKLRHNFTRNEYKCLLHLQGMKDIPHLFGYKHEPFALKLERWERARARKAAARA